MFLPGDYDEYKPSDHAGIRMAQRNLSSEDVDFVLDHGQRLHKAGAVFYFLGRCDIPRRWRRRFERLEGTVLVFSNETNTLITVYRNRQTGLRHIKQKPDRSCKPKKFH